MMEGMLRQALENRRKADAEYDSASQPVDSSAKIEQGPQGFVAHLPWPGIRAENRVVCVASLAGCLFVFWMIWALGNLDFRDRAGQPPPLAFKIGLPLLFGSISVASLLWSLNMGFRSAEIRIDRVHLSILQRGFFGTGQRDLPRDEIKGIDVHPRPYQKRKRRIPSLAICLTNGKWVRVLKGRDARELEWLSCEVRRVLGVDRASLRLAEPGDEPVGGLGDRDDALAAFQRMAAMIDWVTKPPVLFGLMLLSTILFVLIAWAIGSLLGFPF